MKKYRFELSLGLIFALLVVVFLWDNLAAVVPQLPVGLLAVCAIALVSVVAPWPERDVEGRIVSGPAERYAPKEFALAVAWSVVGIAIIIGLAALLNRERFTKTFDLSQRKINSLSTETVSVLKELKTEIEIYCIPSQDPRERYCDENAQLRRLYSEQSGKIRHAAVSLADPALIQQIRPLGMSRLVLLTKDGGRNEVTGSITETKLTNSILNLTKTKRTVYFLTGNGEHPTSMEGDRNYYAVSEFLRNRAYEVVAHKYDKELPADAQLLIAGPAKVPYNSVVENMFRRFLARGGRLILIVNPYRDPGMPKFFAELGIRLDSTLLVGNQGATAFGKELSRLDPLRPPIVIGEFSRNSDITKAFGVNDVGLADGARPMTFAAPEGEANVLKLKGVPLMSAMHTAPVTLTEEQRNRLSLEGDLRLTADAGFDPKKTYPVALSVEIDAPAKLAEGIPAATIASKDGAAPLSPSTGSKDAGKDKVTSEVVVVGFDTVALERRLPLTSNIIPLAVAHLYKEKDLITIPTKDFAPKRFKLERNPASYVALFAFILPLITALSGFYIYVRRRSA